MSKHGQRRQDETVEDKPTVPTDTDTEKAEDKVIGESTEKADEPTEVIDDEPTEVTDDEPSEPAEADEKPERRIQWGRVFAYGVLPAIALVLAMGAGYLKWMDNSVRNSEIARTQSMQAAKDSTIAMLSYKADTVEQQLGAARDLLTGEFRDSYTSLTNDVVIPGAKEKQISAVATIPAVASVSADSRHAVVLLFVNQTVIVGQGAPSDSASSVRVTLDKIGDRWLISKFDPV